MHMAWVDGDRVKALKIAIQSSKMLRDLRQEEFFPSVFMLISELISQFGELVYQRLKSMGFDGKSVSDTFLPS